MDLANNANDECPITIENLAVDAAQYTWPSECSDFADIRQPLAPEMILSEREQSLRRTAQKNLLELSTSESRTINTWVHANVLAIQTALHNIGLDEEMGDEREDARYAAALECAKSLAVQRGIAQGLLP